MACEAALITTIGKYKENYNLNNNSIYMRIVLEVFSEFADIADLPIAIIEKE